MPLSKIKTNSISNPVALTAPVIDGGGYTPFRFKNRIINSDFSVDQKFNGSVVTYSNGDIVADRWLLSCTNTTNKISVGRNANSIEPPTGFANYYGFTSLSSYSIASNNLFGMQQRIEANLTTDLEWGKTTRVPITVSFWVRSSLTGKYHASIRNNGFNRMYIAPYNINSANTWEYKTITIPAPPADDAWNNGQIGQQSALSLFFCIGAGSTYETSSVNTWNSGTSMETFSSPGQVNITSVNGATFYITGVQLEAGSVATQYELRPPTIELTLCQRYLQIVSSMSVGGSTTNLTFFRNRAGANEYDVVYRLSPSMRSAPSVTFESGMRAHFPGVTVIAATYALLSGGAASTAENVPMRCSPSSDQGSGAYQAWIDGDGVTAKRIFFSSEL